MFTHVREFATYGALGVIMKMAMMLVCVRRVQRLSAEKVHGNKIRAELAKHAAWRDFADADHSLFMPLTQGSAGAHPVLRTSASIIISGWHLCREMTGIFPTFWTKSHCVNKSSCDYPIEPGILENS